MNDSNNSDYDHFSAEELESLIRNELQAHEQEPHPTEKKGNGKKGEKVIPEEAWPEKIYCFPLVARPLFPGIAAPYHVEEGPLLEAVKILAQEETKIIGLFLTRDKGGLSSPTKASQIHPIGVAARILRIIPMTNKEGKSSAQLILHVEKRIKVRKFLAPKPQLRASVEYLLDKPKTGSKWVKAYTMSIVSTIKDLVKLNPLYKEELQIFLGHHEFTDPGKLSDFAVSLTTASREELQEVLSAFDVEQRATKALELLKKELDLAKLQSSITEKIESTLSKTQREYFLREQLKAIKRELGLERDEKSCDTDRFQERLSKMVVPEETMEVIQNELEKFSSLDPHSAEYSVSRHYLDWLTSVPWGIKSEDQTNLLHARKILDEDHYGLDDVKERILEFISVGRLTKNLKGSIICLLGPPGVGKTSVGKSIARALGRKFFRFSVGGMSDEAEIRGHRRTYVGAMPGKFLQALKYCQTMNPVILIDEIDKIGNSVRGDPASALLEVLDPEQNAHYLDHYLDVHTDLSDVLFIVTANLVDTIPEPLRDRMEILRLPGYIFDEKLKIAGEYLIPKLRKEAGIKSSDFALQKTALQMIIQGYAREAGVRSLEACLKKILRKCAKQIVQHSEENPEKPYKLTISTKNLETYLGLPRFTSDRFLQEPPAGVAVGLAWTSAGGSTLYIEAIRYPSEKSSFRLTGQPGDVMKESCQLAWSFVHGSVAKYAPGKSFFEKEDVHIHIPEGAVPKDGPSAGITMASALISLLRGQKIPSHIGMTGELTLTGAVLPIGGVREKIMSAKREGITEIIMPFANKKDIGELPKYIPEGLIIHFAKTYDEVFSILFEGQNG